MSIVKGFLGIVIFSWLVYLPIYILFFDIEEYAIKSISLADAIEFSLETKLDSKEDIENITVKGEFVITVNNKTEEIQEESSSVSLNYEQIIKELLNENISSKDILKMMKALGMKRNEAYNLINKLQA